MGKQKRYLALDFGIATGAVVAGSFDGKIVAMEAMHSFAVQSTPMLGTRYWDFPSLIINAKRGMRKYSAKYGPELAGLACSSWSMDFGLLDKNGQLLANPVHFMDKRTVGLIDRLDSIIPERSLYQKTGAKARRQATLYQLFAMALSNSPLLDKAVTVLMIADLISYFFSGAPVQEYTLATTSGMYDAENSDWSRDVILSAKIPPVMVPEIVAPGTMIGPLLDSVAGECGLGMLPVIAPASHNTADAVAAVPAVGEDWAYIISGRQNQIGAEVASPIINDSGFGAGFTNEGGVDGSFRFAKNTNGFTLLEQCAAVWNSEDGGELSVPETLALADGVQPLLRVINPDDPSVVEADNAPEMINAMLRRSGQPLAESRGEFIRACLDGIVLATRRAIVQLAEITGKRHNIVHVAGSAAGNPGLCQMFADALGMPVKAGPVEAQALGNILMQAIALGDIGSLVEAREIVAGSFEIREYLPESTGEWNDAYGRFIKLV